MTATGMLNRTVQNLIVCTRKSEAKVTNNTLRSRWPLKLTADHHKASHGLSATAELLVM